LAHKIPTLEEGLREAGKIPLLIDCKGEGWGPPLAKLLKNFKGPKPIVSAEDSRQLVAFSQQMPDIRCFLSELTKPLETLHTAKVLQLSGICLLYWVYNPLVYFAAKRRKLSMTMYTVNRPAFARFLHSIYPDVMITTDFPDRFAPKRKLRRKKTAAGRKSTKR
jgi:glycerophosphoryl diester phosphodiesterase